MRIKILDAAQADLLSGYAFYERQGSNLGDYFLDSLFSDIDSLLLFGGIHPVHFDKYYRLLSKRFPFAIYYKIDGDTIGIFAVLDCRQDPRRTDDRLKD
ncbi:MAG: type II toxin-antitoxin system RelE/ParE family toxin [Coprothermobacterota bacterium]|nr:type II toxin-antitoxin system RelE/ParE family toxin [Coprothermobacterota bacterium]